MLGNEFRQPSACECGEHAWLVLTKGYVAFVDAHMAPVVGAWTWSTFVSDGTPYAMRRGVRFVNGERRQWDVMLHQQLLCLPSHWTADHVDRNTLNYRLKNLRPSNPGENVTNSRRSSVSGYRGVRRMDSGRFFARIRSRDGRSYLGSFDTAEEAARAYDRAAAAQFGEFAVLNFPQDSTGRH